MKTTLIIFAILAIGVLGLVVYTFNHIPEPTNTLDDIITDCSDCEEDVRFWKNAYQEVQKQATTTTDEYMPVVECIDLVDEANASCQSFQACDDNADEIAELKKTIKVLQGSIVVYEDNIMMMRRDCINFNEQRFFND